MSNKKQKEIGGYTPPPCQKSGYAFVVAATLFKAYGGLCVFVKYKKGDQDRITIKDQSNNHVWLVCPDRELVIVRNSNEMASFYPSGDSFDELHDFNVFNDSVARKMGIKYVMTNYAHSKTTINPRTASRIPDELRHTVLSDSGGLQMARDMIGAISPEQLIEFYNNNADAGMVLDLPLSVANDEIIRRAAILQKKSTDIMLDRSNGVELLNIFHGHNIDQRRAYRKIVEDERVNRCAVGGLYRHSLLGGTDIIWDLVNTGQKYKQYHMLGIFGSLHIPMMIKMANIGWKPHITSDSTSHVQSAAGKSYHFQFDIFHTSKRLAIGTRGSIPNTQKILPCQCAVCAVLKYSDVLAFGSNRFTLELLALHNAIEMTRYTDQLQEAAANMTSKEYNELVFTQLKKHPRLQDVKQVFDFIDVADAKGIEAARKKYANHLDRVNEKKRSTIHGLFGVRVEEDGSESQTLAEKEKRVLGRIAAMEKVVGIEHKVEKVKKVKK